MSAPQPILFVHDVVPKTSVYTSSTGHFKVPNYNRLAIKIWGAGGGGAGCQIVCSTSAGGYVTPEAGHSGSQSYASVPGFGTMHAYGGAAGKATFNGGASSASGGSATGGNTINVGGGASAAGTTGATTGGAGAYGGAGGTGSGAGGAPGGGGGGHGSYCAAPNLPVGYVKASGGGGGGYSYSIFAPGVSGAPAPGVSITWGVGTPGGASAGNTPGGAGGAAKVVFQVS